MGNFEVDEAPLQHEPPQVGGGNGFLRVKGLAVEGSGRQTLDVPVNSFGVDFKFLLRQLVPAEVVGYLVLGVGRNFARPRRVILDAKSKVLGGRISVENEGGIFATPLEGDEARGPTLGDFRRQRRLAQVQRFSRDPSFGRKFGEQELLQRLVDAGCVGVLERRKRRSVEVVAAPGNGVGENDVFRRDRREGQS